ncbi:MAG: hypothetical protein AB1792_08260 [Candidatus Zixiibacteriota bacterium]
MQPVPSISSFLRVQAVVVALVSTLLTAQLSAATTYIGRIEIQNLDIYSPEEATRGWLYRTANILHVQTRAGLIRRFLLFREGDVYDPFLLEESERNLRQLPFLRRVSITAAPPQDSIVDVEIITQDSWTTEPTGAYRYSGGTATYDLEIKEKNLFGTGRALALRYARETERIVRSLSYGDPCLFGPYWGARMSLARNTDGHEYKAEIERPFFSLLTRWQARLAGLDLRRSETIYREGEIDARYRRDHWGFETECGVALTTSPSRAQRLLLGSVLWNDEFGHDTDRPDDILPENQDFRFLTLGYESAGSSFLKVNYVNRGIRFEDFNLARRLIARFGVSPRALGPSRTTLLLQLGVEQGVALGTGRFVQMVLAYQTRWDRSPQNEVLSAEGRLVYKHGSWGPQTSIARVRYDQAWRPDRDWQLVADGDNGLRGYHLHSYAGDRRLIANFEHRLFSRTELLQVVSPGAAIFADIGTAVSPGIPMRRARVGADMGAGLRLGLSRAATHDIIRLDFAWALNRDPLGRRGLLISFATGQAF